eukprot:13070837-Alexandrium_andersonii.AAC.1
MRRAPSAPVAIASSTHLARCEPGIAVSCNVAGGSPPRDWGSQGAGGIWREVERDIRERQVERDMEIARHADRERQTER